MKMSSTGSRLLKIHFDQKPDRKRKRKKQKKSKEKEYICRQKCRGLLILLLFLFYDFGHSNFDRRAKGYFDSIYFFVRTVGVDQRRHNFSFFFVVKVPVIKTKEKKSNPPSSVVRISCATIFAVHGHIQAMSFHSTVFMKFTNKRALFIRCTQLFHPSL